MGYRGGICRGGLGMSTKTGRQTRKGRNHRDTETLREALNDLLGKAICSMVFSVPQWLSGAISMSLREQLVREFRLPEAMADRRGVRPDNNEE